ncbi:alpha/beta hydrolase [Mesonia sp. MT50]|uniref:Alpha/beta hydrolase n=1 Tax=Mesonia profundi TaxID=3070998 RepID=A0ABU1A3A1_9FLAO|nr:alpha/beta hydrolase [Mesonia profundi]MDQ7918166.1 alpha/beta hydrolase [Mesonia profundi]
MRLFFSFLSILLFCSSCAVKKYKDIPFITSTPKELTANIFVPKKKMKLQPVLLFVHGGNWDSGKKETYGFLGRNFAKKGVVTVISEYTLSPQADYKQMTQEVAKSILWIKNNIEDYGGDPQQIYVTGHSAGGHLVALATMDSSYSYGIDKKDIAGIILNDAAGLDMYSYLQKNPPTSENHYLSTWTKNPETWKKASPITYMDATTPRVLMYWGSKSYASIIEANQDFYTKLKAFQPQLKSIVLKKKTRAYGTPIFLALE